MNRRLPELLAPAGSPDALVSALCAGADAVYLGLPRFNARVGAENFDREKLKSAVELCRLYGKKLYVTLNTLVFDKEIPDVLDDVEYAMGLGVDAFIVQDFGLITLLFEVFPDICIHASTQCVTHNTDAIEALSKMGVSRVVIARETKREDIRTICDKNIVETEVFVHGAQCMSHSGSCLMSAYMGGRSGNRGECAQPCRLPWSLDGACPAYPLSLRDLSLAKHVPELIDMGVSSFKIEGRRKSPEYVFGVVSIFRKLIDEKRAATPEEMRRLENIFSRDGFTDGYYTSQKGKAMFGVRGDLDKEKSRLFAEKIPALEKIPIKAEFSVQKNTATLTFSKGDVVCCGKLEVLSAEGDGTSADMIRESLSKLGQTPFFAESVEVFLDEPVFIKRSEL